MIANAPTVTAYCAAEITLVERLQFAQEPHLMSATPAITAHVTLDLHGVSCPGPLVAAKHVVDELEAGQVLLLISDCPGARDDLMAWARHTGKEILQIDELGGHKRAYYIQKGDPHPCNLVLDMRGARCPGPVVEAAKLLDGMQPGEVLKLVSDCKGVSRDVTAWVKARGCTLLAAVENAAGVHRFYIQR
jgi:TusA-related sulfurtransferase